MSERENHAESFERVYEEVFPVLFRVAWHITGDRSAAEDLCQEAFIRYYNRTSPLRTLNDAKYWLIRVVKNLSYNYQKRKGREQSAYTQVFNEPKRELPDGETELLREETSQLVRKALEQLPPKLRSPVILKEYGGLSYKEIGKILRITEGNVKVRIFRARAQLQEYLDQEEIHVS
jgi:RNA polymerase sigma-70 factor, ECF subfamily